MCCSIRRLVSIDVRGELSTNCPPSPNLIRPTRLPHVSQQPMRSNQVLRDGVSLGPSGYDELRER